MAPVHVLTLKIQEDDKDIIVSSSTPDKWCGASLDAWIQNGWVPIAMTGNAERDWALQITKRWDDMKKYAVLSFQEDGKKICPQARTKDMDGLPDNWDDGLSAWTAAGWDIKFFTGNREHGWGAVLCKDA